MMVTVRIMVIGIRSWNRINMFIVGEAASCNRVSHRKSRTVNLRAAGCPFRLSLQRERKVVQWMARAPSTV